MARNFQTLHRQFPSFRAISYSSGQILPTLQVIYHYQHIVAALAETITLMANIDEVIDEHGGWPIE